MAKHVRKNEQTLSTLISDIIRIKADMVAANALIKEAIGTSEFYIALDMRERCWDERADCLKLIQLVGGPDKRDYAASVLCPIG